MTEELTLTLGELAAALLALANGSEDQGDGLTDDSLSGLSREWYAEPIELAQAIWHAVEDVRQPLGQSDQ